MPSTNVGYKSNKLEAGKLQIILGACLACEADCERVGVSLGLQRRGPVPPFCRSTIGGCLAISCEPTQSRLASLTHGVLLLAR
jgi:hypothetical protein